MNIAVNSFFYWVLFTIITIAALNYVVMAFTRSETNPLAMIVDFLPQKYRSPAYHGSMAIIGASAIAFLALSIQRQMHLKK